MKGWKEVLLSSYYDISSGLSKPASEFGKGYPFLSFKDVFWNHFAPDELTSLVNANEKERISCSVKYGDVFLTRTSEKAEELGMSCVALKDYPNATFNGFTKRLRPKIKDEVDPIFMGFYLRSPKFRAEISAYSNLITRASLNNAAINKLRIYIPDYTTQKKIGSILVQYNRLIENNLKRIKLLEESAQRTYEEWFVKFRVNGVVLTIKEETGLPEGWERKRLVDLLTLNYGKALKSDERRYGSFPVYGSSGLIGFHDTFHVKGPGIIVGRKGNVGSVFWCEKNFHPIDTVYYVETDISHYFLYFNLKKQNFINNDAAVPGLNRNAAYMADSFLPPNSLLESFDHVVKPVFDSVENLQNQNSRLSQSRDVLLPRLMNGTICPKQVEERFALAAEPEGKYIKARYEK